MSTIEAIFVVTAVVLLIVRVLPRRWIALLLPPRGEGPSTGELCVACGSRNVTLLGPMVYRCNACGHEPGARRRSSAGAPPGVARAPRPICSRLAACS